MFSTNEYFDGRVKSLSFKTREGKATIGVMAEGEYEFGTSSEELMTVTSGQMSALLPGEKEWKIFNEFESFIVPEKSSFKVRVTSDTSYRCLYK